MTESEKNELKILIGEHIHSIKEEIIELTELTKPVSLDASIGRLSRMDAINNKAINEKALREKKRTLQKLERAQERDEEDKLGTCLKCGNEIPFGRLKIMPYTTRCVQCSGR
ncbi:TraR/DksA family transcriptional regulator [Rhodohalobacter sp. SW132]|uniref:TraR/DksA family transcriptional regulator n=1 Tax=Rhodohalobacter sp. SW132 TaxID=2293433 RepID=UPI000E27098E|nr:TraR/DksA C4-type zinc finger protein [Rhodohalobacter sp. SW132]REL38962.1 TraR/DksA family transcriptional regulator [Rhodohalobacter sp. SW132]